jgi:hypothetical protein
VGLGDIAAPIGAPLGGGRLTEGGPIIDRSEEPRTSSGSRMGPRPSGGEPRDRSHEGGRFLGLGVSVLGYDGGAGSPCVDAGGRATNREELSRARYGRRVDAAR